MSTSKLLEQLDDQPLAAQPEQKPKQDAPLERPRLFQALEEGLTDIRHVDYPKFSPIREVAHGVARGLSLFPFALLEAVASLAPAGRLETWKQATDIASEPIEEYYPPSRKAASEDFDFKGLLAKGVAAGAQSVPQSLSLLPFHAKGKMQALLATAAMYGGPVFKRAFDEAIEAGISPLKAAIRAAGHAASEVGVEFLGDHIFFRSALRHASIKDALKMQPAKVMRSIVPTASKSIGVGMASEAGEEVMNAVLQNFIDLSMRYPKIVRKEDYVLAAIAGATGGGIVGGGASLLNRRFYDSARRIRNQIANQHKLNTDQQLILASTIYKTLQSVSENTPDNADALDSWARLAAFEIINNKRVPVSAIPAKARRITAFSSPQEELAYQIITGQFLRTQPTVGDVGRSEEQPDIKKPEEPETSAPPAPTTQPQPPAPSTTGITPTESVDTGASQPAVTAPTEPLQSPAPPPPTISQPVAEQTGGETAIPQPKEPATTSAVPAAGVPTIQTETPSPSGVAVPTASTTPSTPPQATTEQPPQQTTEAKPQQPQPSPAAATGRFGLAEAAVRVLGKKGQDQKPKARGSRITKGGVTAIIGSAPATAQPTTTAVTEPSQPPPAGETTPQPAETTAVAAGEAGGAPQASPAQPETAKGSETTAETADTGKTPQEQPPKEGKPVLWDIQKPPFPDIIKANPLFAESIARYAKGETRLVEWPKTVTWQNGGWKLAQANDKAALFLRHDEILELAKQVYEKNWVGIWEEIISLTESGHSKGKASVLEHVAQLDEFKDALSERINATGLKLIADHVGADQKFLSDNILPERLQEALEHSWILSPNTRKPGVMAVNGTPSVVIETPDPPAPLPKVKIPPSGAANDVAQEIYGKKIATSTKQIRLSDNESVTAIRSVSSPGVPIFIVTNEQTSATLDDAGKDWKEGGPANLANFVEAYKNIDDPEIEIRVGADFIAAASMAMHNEFASVAYAFVHFAEGKGAVFGVFSSHVGAISKPIKPARTKKGFNGIWCGGGGELFAPDALVKALLLASQNAKTDVVVKFIRARDPEHGSHGFLVVESSAGVPGRPRIALPQHGEGLHPALEKAVSISLGEKHKSSHLFLEADAPVLGSLLRTKIQELLRGKPGDAVASVMVFDDAKDKVNVAWSVRGGGGAHIPIELKTGNIANSANLKNASPPFVTVWEMDALATDDLGRALSRFKGNISVYLQDKKVAANTVADDNVIVYGDEAPATLLIAPRRVSALFDYPAALGASKFIDEIKSDVQQIKAGLETRGKTIHEITTKPPPVHPDVLARRDYVLDGLMANKPLAMQSPFFRLWTNADEFRSLIEERRRAIARAFTSSNPVLRTAAAVSANNPQIASDLILALRITEFLNTPKGLDRAASILVDEYGARRAESVEKLDETLLSGLFRNIEILVGDGTIEEQLERLPKPLKQAVYAAHEHGIATHSKNYHLADAWNDFLNNPYGFVRFLTRETQRRDSNEIAYETIKSVDFEPFTDSEVKQFSVLAEPPPTATATAIASRPVLAAIGSNDSLESVLVLNDKEFILMMRDRRGAAVPSVLPHAIFHRAGKWKGEKGAHAITLRYDASSPNKTDAGDPLGDEIYGKYAAGGDEAIKRGRLKDNDPAFRLLEKHSQITFRPIGSISGVLTEAFAAGMAYANGLPGRILLFKISPNKIGFVVQLSGDANGAIVMPVEVTSEVADLFSEPGLISPGDAALPFVVASAAVKESRLTVENIKVGELVFPESKGGTKTVLGYEANLVIKSDAFPSGIRATVRGPFEKNPSLVWDAAPLNWIRTALHINEWRNIENPQRITGVLQAVALGSLPGSDVLLRFTHGGGRDSVAVEYAVGFDAGGLSFVARKGNFSAKPSIGWAVMSPKNVDFGGYNHLFRFMPGAQIAFAPDNEATFFRDPQTGLVGVLGNHTRPRLLSGAPMASTRAGGGFIKSIGVDRATVERVLDDVAEKIGRHNLPSIITLEQAQRLVGNWANNKEGFWFGGESYVVADNIGVRNDESPAQAAFRVIVHEALHDRLMALAAADPDLAGELEAAALSLGIGAPLDIQERVYLLHEILAERAPHYVEGQRNMVRRLWDAFWAWLAKTFPSIFRTGLSRPAREGWIRNLLERAFWGFPERERNHVVYNERLPDWYVKALLAQQQQDTRLKFVASEHYDDVVAELGALVANDTVTRADDARAVLYEVFRPESIAPYVISIWNDAVMAVNRPEMVYNPAKEANEALGVVEGQGLPPGRPPMVWPLFEMVPEPDEIIQPTDYNGYLKPEQRFGANLILTAYKNGHRGFMLSDGVGVGKTAQIVAVIDRVSKLNPDKPVLLIVPAVLRNQLLGETGSYYRDGMRMGIDVTKMVRVASYNDLAANKIPPLHYSMVVFDEAHFLRNAESRRSVQGKLLKADFRLYVTATPVDQPVNMAYFIADLTGQSIETIMNQLGFRAVPVLDQNGKVVVNRDGDPVYTYRPIEGVTWADVILNMLEWRNMAVRSGTMLRREFPFYGEVSVRRFEMTPEEKKFHDNWISTWNELIDRSRQPRTTMLSGMRTQEGRRLAELMKTNRVIESALDFLNTHPDKKLVICGYGINDTSILKPFARSLKEKIIRRGMLNVVAEALEKEGHNVARIFGGADAASEADRFQQDNTCRVAIVNPAKAGFGIDLDDQTGQWPRTVWVVSFDYSGWAVDQLIGRFSRRNTASPVTLEFWALDGHFGDARASTLMQKKLNTMKLIQKLNDPDQAALAASTISDDNLVDLVLSDPSSPVLSSYLDVLEAASLVKRSNLLRGVTPYGRGALTKQAMPKPDGWMLATGQPVYLAESAFEQLKEMVKEGLSMAIGGLRERLRGSGVFAFTAIRLAKRNYLDSANLLGSAMQAVHETIESLPEQITDGDTRDAVARLAVAYNILAQVYRRNAEHGPDWFYSGMGTKQRLADTMAVLMGGYGTSDRLQPIEPVETIAADEQRDRLEDSYGNLREYEVTGTTLSPVTESHPITVSAAAVYRDKGAIIPVESNRISSIAILSPSDVAALAARMRDRHREHFHVIMVDEAGQMVPGGYYHKLGDTAEVHITDIEELRRVIANARTQGAVAAYVFHNHPSGDPTPSMWDVRSTSVLSKMFSESGIELRASIVTDGLEYSIITPSTGRAASWQRMAFPYLLQTGAPPRMSIRIATAMDASRYAAALYDAHTTIVSFLYVDENGVLRGARMVDLEEAVAGAGAIGRLLEDDIRSIKRPVSVYVVAAWPDNETAPSQSALKRIVRQLKAVPIQRLYTISVSEDALAEHDDDPLSMHQPIVMRDAAPAQNVPLKGIPPPEMLEMARELGAIVIGAEQSGFKPHPQSPLIKIARSAAANGDFASELGRQIGHLFDFAGHYTLRRGGVLPRLMSEVWEWTLKSLRQPVDADTHKRLFGHLPNPPTEADFRNELTELSNWWNPPPEDASATELQHRKSAQWLYADFISVLLNDPQAAQQRAPLSYALFFDRLNQKPEALKAYTRLQAILLDHTAYNERRLNALEEMFERGDEIARALRLLAAYRGSRPWTALKVAFVDKLIGLREKTDKKAGFNPHSIAAAAEEFSLNGVFTQAILSKIAPVLNEIEENGFRRAVAAVMFLQRVAEGDRSELLNPKGYTQETATATLEYLRTRNPQAYAKAFEYANKIHEWMATHVHPLLTDVLTPEQLKLIHDNRNTYATFRVIEYMAPDVTPMLHESVGTLSDIGDPLSATIMKAVALVKVAHRNAAKRKVAELMLAEQNAINAASSDEMKAFLLKHGLEPEVVNSLPRDITVGVELANVQHVPGKGVVAIGPKPRNPNLKLLTWKQNGQWHGIWADRYVVDSLDATSPEETALIAEILKKISANRLFRELYIIYNLRFHQRNFLRDFLTIWRVPNITFLDALKEYLNRETWREAADAARGNVYGAMADMSLHGGRSFTLAEILGDVEITSQESEIGYLLRQYNLSTRNMYMGKELNPVLYVLRVIHEIGSTLELMPKLSAWKVLRGKGVDPKTAAYITRNYVGTPNPKRRGLAYHVTNELFLFSNIQMQGLRRDFELATSPATAFGWWWKTIGLVFIPKLFMKAAKAGLLFWLLGGNASEWLKKLYEKIGHHVMSRYIVMPLGETSLGDALHLRVPVDQASEILGALFWNILELNERGPVKTAQDLVNLFWVTLPFTPSNLMPMADIAINGINLLRGVELRDDFRNRSILTRDELDALQSYPLPAFKKYFLWVLGQMGVLSPMAIPKRGSLTPIKERIDAIFEHAFLPMITPFIGVSSIGEIEKAELIIGKTKAEEASARLRKAEAIESILRVGGSAEDYVEIVSPINAQEYRAALKKFAREKTRWTKRNRYNIALLLSSSTEQKLTALREIGKTMTPDEFEGALREFIQLGLIGLETAQLAYYEKTTGSSISQIKAAIRKRIAETGEFPFEEDVE